jgi:hypothetical protein
MKMNICIVGWFWTPEFLNIVSRIQHKHPAFIVAHNEPSSPPPIPYCTIPNIGLEFGAYDFFIKKVWKGKSNVFFTHDDSIVSETKLKVFDRISAIKHDCTYLFRDMSEEEANGGKHGRAIFCSKKFLDYIIEDNNGFWHDEENKGFSGAKGQPHMFRKDGSRINFNVGIHTFHKYLGKVRDRKIGLDVVNRVYFPDYECGRRGTWRHKEREWERYGDKK